MTALTTDRYLKDLEAGGMQGRGYGTPANAQFYFGQILCKGTDDGLIKPVSGSANLVCVGVSNQGNFNVTPTNPLPLPFIEFRYGVFDFSNDGSVTANTAPGTLLYAADDNTATTSSSGNAPVLGRFVEYQSGLQYPVFVAVGPATTVKGATF